MTLTKPDHLIKKLMLTFPCTHYSRTATLFAIFLDEFQNYYWDADGCVAESNPLPPRDSMDVLAQESTMQAISEKMEHLSGEDQDNVRHFLATAHARNELEMMKYRHRQDNIDLYVQENIGHDDATPLRKPAPRSLEHTLLGQLPQGAIDPEWALAAHDVVIRILHCIIGPRSMPYVHPRGEDTSLVWADHYAALTATLDRLHDYLPPGYRQLISLESATA